MQAKSSGHNFASVFNALKFIEKGHDFVSCDTDEPLSLKGIVKSVTRLSKKLTFIKIGHTRDDQVEDLTLQVKLDLEWCPSAGVAAGRLKAGETVSLRGSQQQLIIGTTWIDS